MDLSFFNNFSPTLTVFILAMLPMGELRVSIPVGLLGLDMPVWQVYALSVLGNMIPSVIIIYLLGPAVNVLRKIPIFEKFFSWLFNHTRKKFDGHYKNWGNIALMIFVAIPLPVTGAWTGSVAAWLFGIGKARAVLFIFLGVMIAGLIVSLVSLGALSFLNFVI